MAKEAQISNSKLMKLLLTFGINLNLIHLWFITSCELCHLKFRFHWGIVQW